MTQGNLIYLALITERVPIIGRFTGSPNIGLDIEPIRFGEIFDLTRLRKSLGIPIVEWDDIKDPSSQYVDEIGCWSIWLAVQDRESQPRHCPITEVLKLGMQVMKQVSAGSFQYFLQIFHILPLLLGFGWMVCTAPFGRWPHLLSLRHAKQTSSHRFHHHTTRCLYLQTIISCVMIICTMRALIRYGLLSPDKVAR